MAVHPLADDTYSVKIDRQNYRGESRNDQTLFDYQLEIAITVDVIGQQRRRQQRAKIGDGWKILANNCSLAHTESEGGDDDASDEHERGRQRSHDALFTSVRRLPGDQQLRDSNQAEHVCNPESEGQHKEVELHQHRGIRAPPEFRYSNRKKYGRQVRKINSYFFTAREWTIGSVGPEENVDVQQKRISEGDANYGDRISNTEPGGPLVVTKTKEVVKRDDELSCVPATDA